jgi:hypothetical protein
MKLIAFHGSNKSFTKFAPSAKRVENDFFGGGIAYFTDDQKVALTYSRAMTYRYGGEEHLYKVELSIDKMFDVDTIYTGDNLRKFFKLINVEDFARGAGLLKAGEDKYAITAKLELGNYQMTGYDVFRGLSKGFGRSEQAQDILKKLGYDGLRYNGGQNMGTGRHNVYLPYHENDIKLLNKYKVQRKKPLTEWTFEKYIKAHKNEIRTLNVWDIDDTLFGGFAGKVRIKDRDGKTLKTLTPAEFNHYRKAPEEVLDFDDFRDGKLFRATVKPINNVLKAAINIIHNQTENSESIILTARSDFNDKTDFLQAFRDYGFPIDQVYVERSGNLQKLKADVKVNVQKGVILKRYINSGKYDRVRIWDDSTKNLDMALKLAKPGVEVIAYHVDHTGAVKRYGSSLREEIEAPKIGMTFSRALMPQIKKESVPEFLAWLIDKNISNRGRRMKVTDLRATQMEFDYDKVAAMIGTKSKTPVLVSNDGYILDGHHRWLADYNMDKETYIDVVEIDLPILELLRVAKEYDGVEYKNVTESIKTVVRAAHRRKTYSFVI